MSRGPGQTQRAIQTWVDKRPDEVVPVRIIARLWADAEGVKASAHLHASFRRAATSLCNDRLINGWDLVLPTYLDESGRPRGYRHVFCVGSSTITELTREHIEGAELVVHIFGGL